MDGQQHMTITEAHPYHEGRGCKVFNPNCPLCRNDSAKETTYVGWSLHQATLAAAEARATAAEGRVRDLIDDYQLLSIEVRAWRQFYRDTKAKIDALDVKLDDALARAALRKDAATTHGLDGPSNDGGSTLDDDGAD